MGKRKEPMGPSGFWFFFQFIPDFSRRLLLPFRQGTGTIDIFFINVQTRIVRIQSGHQVVTPHSRLPDKIDVRRVYLINVQASVLAAQGIFPLSFVSISDYEDNLVPCRCVKTQVRHLILSGPISFVLNQNPEIIQNPQILVYDILLCSSGVIRGQDVQLLRRLRHLEHELEQANGCLARCCC